MNPYLDGFITFLEKQGLLEFDIDGDGDSHFTNRLKLQKYAFLAKRFGMPFDYKHGIYLYGPYSGSLADDYYDLARGGRNPSADALPDVFNKDGFLESIHDDPDWLEIATTIIDRHGQRKNRTVLVEDVCRVKSGFDRKFITGVLNDLVKHDLVVYA